MHRTEPIPWRAALAVAAVYVAFLLCAQFGFLAQLEQRLGSDARFLHLVLAAMGGGGIAGSWFAARRLPKGDAGAAVRAGLIATALATGASPLASGAVGLALAATALGGSLGFTTVALAGGLPRLVAAGARGRVAGVGTGVAYLISNLPPLFAGPPAVRALVPAALCAVAAYWAPRSREESRADDLTPAGESPLRFAGLVAAFAALVAVDSAAFAHVQRTPELLAATWGGAFNSSKQGVLHLLAALGAGIALDRRRLRETLVATALLFALVLPALADPELRFAAGALYALGISAYSAALVAAPSLVASPTAAPRRAALLYSVAGWIGSAAGVGAAEDGAFRAVALLGVCGFALWTLTEILPRRRALMPLAGAIVVGALGALLVATEPGEPTSGTAGTPELSAVARGREVYLAEGCQHCHSQYVRPSTHDELWWGPARALDRREHPPTPGNRRIGPDLANVGLRRSAWWQEAHLRDPRAVSPGSRMPSYAHLFGDERGGALVAYLGSLGAGGEEERAAAVAAWRPVRAESGDAVRGGELFARHCVSCHGPGGRGDGSAAAAIARPTMDLTLDDLPLVVPRDGESREAALARAIRFGLPPFAMPGHEWLSEDELADLVAFVGGLGAPDHGRRVGG